MQVVCDRCGGATKPKKITSKKTGKEYTVYECQNGCMNGKYPYSCFAPKVGATTGAVSASGDLAKTVNEIRDICIWIQSQIKKQNKPVPTVDVDAEGFPFPEEDE